MDAAGPCLSDGEDAGYLLHVQVLMVVETQDMALPLRQLVEFAGHDSPFPSSGASALLGVVALFRDVAHYPVAVFSRARGGLLC